MQSVAKNAVVHVSYVLRDSKGEVLDEAGADDGFWYLHGHENIVPGLEKALEGRVPGDKVKADLTPDEGYGDYDPAQVRRFEKADFPARYRNPDIGTELQIQEEGGVWRVWRVQSVEKDSIVLDGNHELAGQDLHFEVEVIALREATAEEIEHGHAHAPGHHHH